MSVGIRFSVRVLTKQCVQRPWLRLKSENRCYWRSCWLKKCRKEMAQGQVDALKPRRALGSNRKVLAYVRRRMVKLQEQALLKKKREAAGQEDQEGDLADDGGDVSQGESSATDDDPEKAAARAADEDWLPAAELETDAMPCIGADDGPAGDVGGDEWQTAMTLEGQVSAAGPAVAAADFVPGARPEVGVSAELGGG